MGKVRFTNSLLLIFLVGVLILSLSTPFTSASSLSDEPRGFKHTGELKIQLEYNWSMSSETGIAETFDMWIPRITNHSHPTKTGTAPLQSSIVVSNSTNMIPDLYSYIPKDDYNNSIEYFSVTVNPGEEFRYSITYNLTLRETDWTIRESEEGEFDVENPVYQNLTGAETHLEADNPTLVSLSDSICEGKTSIKDKVNAIVTWMKRNLDFNGGQPDQGAYLTYLLGSGDCSDMATFFVTMLRIQGIPARKLCGLQLWNYDKEKLYHNLKVGQEINYFAHKIGNDFSAMVPGHAMTEYYIPNYGFVSLDPTLVRTDRLRYTNFFEYTYIISSVGENYGGGIDPAFPSNVIEWGIIPYITSPSSKDWSFTLKFTVLETSNLFVIPSTAYFVIVGFPCSIIAFTVNLLIRRKRKKNLEITQKVDTISEKSEK